MSNLVKENIKDPTEANYLITNFKVIHSFKDKIFAPEFENQDVYYPVYKDYLYQTIEKYFKAINPHYDSIIETFKNKYINTEAVVEKNDTPEQMEGLRHLYDYIQSADTKNINILVESLKINSILWKPTDDKNNKDIAEYKEKLHCDINKLNKLITENHDMSKYNEYNKLLEEYNGLNYKSKVGGVLRSNDNLDNVMFHDTDFKVPKASAALTFINSFSSKEKLDELNNMIKSDNIGEYINYCVKICVDLIKYQPFMDGNKRTFRGLLNLLFKAKNIPPIYIRIDEIDIYKKALFKAIIKGDYSDIDFFYLYKICASIYELDVEPYIVMEETKESVIHGENANKNIRDI